MRKIELLSPAKNAETAKSAILCGADSVYIGPEEFGARSAASNPTEDIAELCDFAHLYGCKVYAALNTILFDGEIPRAARLAQKLYEAGVDAFIVQDLGLLEYGLPPIPVHASTQCDISSAEKAKFLEACGFDALVLVRELTLREISEISRSVKKDTRLECFVHGALCVSHSGRCWLSHAIGGRSGNRGKCAQPCRMKYELTDAEGSQIAPPAYYLSLRDMNRSASIGEMIDAGVDIFKIEGRLKDAGYVKNITALYRKILDAELAKRGLERASYGRSEIPFEASAEKSFNRGFCEYFLHGTEGSIAAFSTPKSRGEHIGKVSESFRNGFIFDNASEIFSNGDGLLFESGGRTFGASVIKIDGDKVFVESGQKCPGVPKGARIFRNKNAAFEKLLAKPAERKMPVGIRALCKAAETVFSMETADGRKASATTAVETGVKAVNPVSSRAKLAENLAKLGNTPFFAKSVIIETESGEIPFLRASEINEIRRRLCEALKSDILSRHGEARRKAPSKPKFFKAFKSALGPEWNVSNRFAENFYGKFGAEVSGRAYEAEAQSMDGKRVMTTKHCILRELGMCKKKAGGKIPKEPIFLSNEAARLRLFFDCARCGMEVYFEGRR